MLAVSALIGYGTAALAMLCVYQDLFFRSGFVLVMAFELAIFGAGFSTFFYSIISTRRPH